MSQPRHLDEQTLAALVADPSADPELLAHLASACEQCEAFLAAHPGPGVLDGAVDAALLSLAPAGPEPELDRRGFSRLGRVRSAQPRRRLAYAAAGLALVGLVLALRLPDDAQLGVKGAANEAVELQAVWRSPQGTLEAVGPGAELPARGTLLFRARSPRAGRGLLLVQRGEAAPEVLHAAEVSAGLEDLRSEAGALGLSLDGEAGRLLVWLIVGDTRTAPSLDDARRAVDSGAVNAVAVGRFELHVKP